MLKDSLKILSEEAEKYVDCRIGRLMQEKEFQDEETVAIFRSAMKSKASSRSIWEALRTSGLGVDRAAIDKARSCFRGQQQCSCGAGEQR